MSAEKRKVWVVGHKNPDTDSIGAALSYANLKNQTENDKTYVAKRAGAVNAETHYVLDYFGAQEPELVTYAGTQIKDINFRRTAGVSSQISLRRAWETMKKLEVVTLPVTNQFGKLEGIIVTKDIATSYMDVFDNHVLSQARTQYKNIAATLDGTIIVGNEHAYFVRGKVVVATSNPEYMADYIEYDDMVILGDREEAQKQAIESNASCLIIGGGMAYTFLKAQGLEVGKSLVDDEKIDYCKEMMAKAEKLGKKLLLPVDAVTIKDFPNPIDAPVEVETYDADKMPADREGCDIGPKTQTLFADAVKTAKTVVWNGPMGVFENPTLAAGTIAVAKALADTDATTIIGGGDSAAAVNQLGFGDKMSHISTGGGASLEFLEGKELPGVAAANDK